MNIQNLASNLYQRVGRAGQTYRGVRRVWRETQREAVAVVTHNSRSVANTEIGAAKNIYTSAQAAFRRAKRDGLRKVANRPTRYVPAGRKQMAAAYRATLTLLGRTRSELAEVASGGYRQMSAQLAGTVEAIEAQVAANDQAAQDPSNARKRPTKRAATAEAGAARARRAPRKRASTSTTD